MSYSNGYTFDIVDAETKQYKENTSIAAYADTSFSAEIPVGVELFYGWKHLTDETKQKILSRGSYEDNEFDFEETGIMIYGDEGEVYISTSFSTNWFELDSAYVMEVDVYHGSEGYGAARMACYVHEDIMEGNYNDMPIDFDRAMYSACWEALRNAAEKY